MTIGQHNLFTLLVMGLTHSLTWLGRHNSMLNAEQTSVSTDSSQYAIIFDAGSTKTKMEIYKIDVNSPPLDVTDVHQLDSSPSRVKPGIADLAGNPPQVEAYLKPLLDSAMKTIPAEKHSTTPMFFLATAGMRLLSKDQSKAILDEVKKLFSDKTKCPFIFDSEDARIISGAFEGIYGWISVNFLKGNFIPGNSHPTYGTLDLGGASHQNTFDFIRKNNKDLYSLEVGGKKYHLFARSYLGYGLIEARKRYLELLSQGPLTNEVLESPCHHKGFHEQIDINGQKISVVGTADVLACRSIIEKTFFCEESSCPFHDQPKLHGDFFGFSAIFYAAVTTEILCYNCTRPLSPAMFDKGSRNFCAKSYEMVSSDPYAKEYCFGGNFVYELLTKGYCLSADKTIVVGKKLEGFSLGWTLGAVLYNSGLL